ncbi:MAG: S8 family serine peptidase [Chitinophagaceae bacterium]
MKKNKMFVADSVIRIKQYFLFILVSLFCSNTIAQSKDWLHKDLYLDGIFGVSTERAYNSFLTKKNLLPVIVAVIDSGIDTTHENLKSSLWVNAREVPGNGIDDDNNGYIDDIHGWNFNSVNAIGNVIQEDIACVLRTDKEKYDSLANVLVSEKDKLGYQRYRLVQNVYYEFYGQVKKFLIKAIEIKELLEWVQNETKNESPSLDEVKKLMTEDNKKGIVNIVALLDKGKSFKQIFDIWNEQCSLLEWQMNFGLSLKKNIIPRRIGDTVRKGYGDNNIQEGDIYPFWDIYHGTHVAGIIGARRKNNAGMDGVSVNAVIMPIKICAPFREPNDQSLADAIRYAVDNGAKIINMSFGKPYTYNKQVVDDAVKYAMDHDVLIVHAAMNKGVNLDITSHFPNKIYNNGEEAHAWLEVGASAWKDDSTLVAPFSNYGQASVDVFAPGQRIFSTIPASRFDFDDGTSMAAPVVSGIAAVIRGCFPDLTAIQVKNLIMKSVVRVNHNVEVRNEYGQLLVLPFSEICKSGGVVNMFSALKMVNVDN